MKKSEEVTKENIDALRAWSEQVAIPEDLKRSFDAVLGLSARLLEILAANASLRKALGDAFSGKGKSESVRGARAKASTSPNANTPSPSAGNNRSRVTSHKPRKEEKPVKGKEKAPRHPEAIFSSELAGEKASAQEESSADGLRIAKGDEVGSLRSEWNEKEVIDIKVVVTRRKVRVQTLTNPRTGQQVSGEIKDAPKGSKYSFGTYLLVALMHVQMCMPYTRIAIGLGIPKVACYDMVRYLAAACLPIYLHLWRELAKRRYLMVDDTTTKILEKTPTDRRSDEGEEEEGGSSENLTPLAPSASLMAAISKSLGLPSLGTTAEGKKAAVTVLHGYDGQNDHASRITFFLSHRGQAGDLLEILLASRSRRDDPVAMVSDMLAANFPSSATRERTRMVSAACAAHARRRFFAARDLDDEMWFFLRGFMILADIETYAKENERRPKEVLRIRKLHAGRVWRLLKAHAETFQAHSGWEPSSAPYKACTYLLKHYEALTRYLDDPNLPWTNNLCERALRREKIMLGASHFRETFEGHAALDVITSLLATCTRVGGVDFATRDYLIDVMKHREAVALNPEAWTPATWLRRNPAPNA